MCAFDMGGPVNKADYVTGTALLTANNDGTWTAMDADERNGLVLGDGPEEDNIPHLPAFLADRLHRRSAAAIAAAARITASADSVKPAGHGSHRKREA